MCFTQKWQQINVQTIQITRTKIGIEMKKEKIRSITYYLNFWGIIASCFALRSLNWLIWHKYANLSTRFFQFLIFLSFADRPAFLLCLYRV